MRKILLVGDFKGLQPLFGGFAGYQFVHCHSIESLRGEWAKPGVGAVVLSVRQLTPSVFELLDEARTRLPSLKWGIVVREVNHQLAPYNSKTQMFFQGTIARDWGPRLKRFLEGGVQNQRGRDRKPFRGGVRVKDSEFAKASTGRRAYGNLRNLSPQGAALVFDQELPFPAGEFLEVTFRDQQGVARSFHGQIKWRRDRGDGTVEVGLQFLAAA